MNENEGKSWYQSKTLWFNLITGIVGIAGNVMKDGSFTPKMNGILATVVMAGNFILRMMTDTQITK